MVSVLQGRLSGQSGTAGRILEACHRHRVVCTSADVVSFFIHRVGGQSRRDDTCVAHDVSHGVVAHAPFHFFRKPRQGRKSGSHGREPVGRGHANLFEPRRGGRIVATGVSPWTAVTQILSSPEWGGTMYLLPMHLFLSKDRSCENHFSHVDYGDSFSRGAMGIAKDLGSRKDSRTSGRSRTSGSNPGNDVASEESTPPPLKRWATQTLKRWATHPPHRPRRFWNRR